MPDKLLSDDDLKNYKAFFENSKFALFFTKPDGQILEANAAACRLFGYTAEEFRLLGRNGIIDTSPELEKSLLKRKKTGHAEGILTAIKKNGERFECQYSSTIYQSGSGEGFTSTILIDISAEVAKDKKISEATSYMEMILDTTTESFILINKDLEVVSFNKTAENFSHTLVGVPLVKGSSIFSLASPDAKARLTEMYAFILEGNTMVTKYTAKNGSGEPIVFNIHYTPIKDKTNKNVSHIMINAKDITAEELARQQLEVDRNELVKSELRYKHMFYSNPLPMWIYDQDSKRFLEVNDAAIEHYGYSRSEFLSRTIFDIRSPDEAKKLSSIINKRSDYLFLYHKWKHLKKNGEEIIVEVNSHPINYDNHEATLVCINDITERVKLETELKNYNRTVKNILESITDGFLSVNMDWLISCSNSEAEKLAGISSEEMEGKDLWEIFSSTIPRSFKKKFASAITSKKSVHFEQYVESRNIWLDIAAYPSTEGLSIYFRNITDRKNVEQQVNDLNLSLQNRAQELSISNQELENFAYVASHDLQEPLRMITSFLQLFDKKYRGAIDETGNRYIQFAVDGAMRMNSLILDLLEYAKVGRSEDKPRVTDMNDVTREVLEDFSLLIKSSNANIEVGNLPKLCGVISSQMHQLMQNLIGNALKYQQPGNCPHIQISCKEQQETWLFIIKDDGIGIDNKFASKIFVIFQRLHNKNEYSGTGIGLAICKKIVDLHGGQIWMESQKNKGSSFYFTIPKAIAQ
ncbi:MAG: hypothetical protein NVS3B19_17280 [Ginsengibacter sp.]